jgi:plastocyanin
MKILRVLMMLAMLFVGAACGEEKQVGSGVDAEKLAAEQNRLGEQLKDLAEEDVGEDLSIGKKEEEAAQGDQANEQQDAETARRQAEQRQQQEVAAQREQAAFAFDITSSGYNPYYIRIFAGGTVKVTNKDSVKRSVTADKGEFDSGMLNPGETWVGGPFPTAGKIAFHDATRPYIVGTLEVCKESGC